MVEKYAQKVWMICYSYLQSKEDSEDVSQDIFTAIYISLDKFKGNSSVATWVHSIALNKSKEYLRNRNRKKRKGFLISITGSEKGEEFIASEVSNGIEEKEEIIIVKNALNQLPENQRIVYSMVKLEEFSYKEVEEMTGFSKSAIESLMFRAKGNLIALLKEYYTNNYK